MRLRNIFHLCAVSVILAGCGTRPIQPSNKHIQQAAGQPPSATGIPQPVRRGIVLPPPKPVARTETYSVIVTNVPAQEILFELARDAKINLDIHPGIQGTVTLNALKQTLPQILTRIARQIDMRYELDNGNLTVMPDTPYLHNYKIDYVNMTRDSEGGISNTTQMGGSTSGSNDSGSNNSRLTIKNSSKNRFWETLTQNIKDILRETDKEIIVGRRSAASSQQGSAASNQQASLAGSANSDSSQIQAQATAQASKDAASKATAESEYKDYQTLLAASVIANPENSIITVRATGKQHEKIQEFIDRIMSNARRQVLIEATIVEVQLSDNYQQGIDWSKFLAVGTTKGFNINQTATPLSSNAGSLLVNYVNPTSKFGNLAASVSLLETFGNVKVLSSPKLSVMNNQTAMLRVADNLAYFEMDVTPATHNTDGSEKTPTVYKTTLKTSPVGFTMSLTPQINDSDTVLLNIRPSITRLLNYVNDPNPELAKANVVSRVPQTSTREMESVLKIENNQIAILGGLMEDSIDKQTQEVPLLGGIPLLGNLFKNRNDTTTKTELVIFLRPMVIKDASIDGDFSAYRDMLPDQDFFKEPANGKP